MKRMVAIILSVCLLVPLLPLRSKAVSNENITLPFTDVETAAWYIQDVQYIYERGLMNGTSGNRFSPDMGTTRAMLVVILYRLAGCPDSAGQTVFLDVKPGIWYADAVSWAVEQGIVMGMSKTEFWPDTFITREQTATFLCRYAHWMGYDVSPETELAGFSDGDSVADWSRDALSWCVGKGLINGIPSGDDLRLSPLQGTTRAQLAAMLHRLCTGVLELDRLHVAYIPLDNRPVNNLRPIYQMESGGARVHMPEESLYATRMDGQEPNPNGTTYGDREGLLEWLKMEERRSDVFVLSLDQLLSGGLVSSRSLNGDDLSLEYEIIDYLAELSQRKPVYLFDTVMRLASTVGYQGMGMEEYNAFRSYGAKKRETLTGDELTIENIVAGYPFDQNGEPIDTELPEDALSAYHAARKRKLLLADRLLSRTDGLAGLLIGVDDSYPLNSIQTNEIAYLQGHLQEGEFLFCGTDELGMMAMAMAYTDSLNYTARVRVRYFGRGEDWVVDQYDTASLHEAVEQHMLALGLEVEEEAPDAEILVLTRGSDATAAEEFMAAWLENDASGMPTIVIDTSGTADTYETLLDELPVKELMGYSCWGTGGNTIGIALAMGLTHLAWLDLDENDPEAMAAFQRSLTFAFVKDIAYCGFCRYSLTDLSPEGIESLVMSNNQTQRILSGLEGKELLSPGGSYESFPRVSLDDFSAPFQRANEIRFRVLLGDEIPPEPPENQEEMEQ